MTGNVSPTEMAGTGDLWTRFRAPPPDARPMVRWWWFGGAVEPDGIVREIGMMKAAGFGGFEIQPVYPLALDDPATGIRNIPYLSEDFLDRIALAARTGRQEGLRVDLTLGSGWPFGGPHIPAEHAASCIVRRELAVEPGVAAIDLPVLPEGHRYIAAFLLDGGTPADAVEVPLGTGARIAVPPAEGARILHLIEQGRTGQQVKRATVGAEGYVLDHMSETALRRHLDAVGKPLLKVFGADRPHAVFSDSLESYGSDWTDDLLEEFAPRRGYDLKPHLLELFIDSPRSAGIRYDWCQTLTELVGERYLTPLREWAIRHRTLFRSQTYGYPPVTLSSNRLVDLAEGEGAEWRGFSTCRWASSANHLYGQPVTSAETWTWLHKGAFRATPLDIKAEADAHLLSGINQFIAHGWPYSPPQVPEPGWAFYAAAVFNTHNPWWPVMAEVNLYVHRMSHLLRQGINVADIAIYLPTEDVMSALKPASPGESIAAGEGVSIDKQMRRRIAPDLVARLLDAGYNFDFIDAEAVLARGIAYPVLLLPEIERIVPAVYEHIRDFVRAGGTVVALGEPPSAAPGLLDAQAGDAIVAGITSDLFGTESSRALQTNAVELIGTLRAVIAPDLVGLPPGVGFVHRQVRGGDIYFVANATNAPVAARPGFRVSDPSGQSWDPVTGTARAFVSGSEVLLAPYESRLFVFGAVADAPLDATEPPSLKKAIPLTEGWTLAIGDRTVPLETFSSWTEVEETRFHSGEAAYTTDINLAVEDASAGSVTLDFGPGTPAAEPERDGPGMSARLDAPVRDAAEIFVNGERAGAVWQAPFVIEIGSLLQPGRNRLEIRVYNTAINLLAGRPGTDYAPLEAVYGKRFDPQNMDNLKPLPSGLLTAPVLRIGR